jgi:putative acetyltransferase
MIRCEMPADERQVWDVNRQAFEGELEANLVNALRADGYAAISLVAEIEDEIVGHILFSPVRIQGGDRVIEALALAPLAVLPLWQRQGIGSKLVVAGIEEGKKQGHEIVTVLGHPSFYPRFGFSAELARPLISPFGDGDAWMALELATGSLAGVSGRVEYAPPFMTFT